MMRLFSSDGEDLDELTSGSDPARAVWIDLYEPTAEEAAQLEPLGVDLPTFADMREIEVSNRLYRVDHTDYMTVVVPGIRADGAEKLMPVTFILSSDRLITVRYHVPRPFTTYPQRASTAAAGCSSTHRIALGLAEEIIGRQADLIEGIAEELDKRLAEVLDGEGYSGPNVLRSTLRSLGLQGELLGLVRLGLLSLERALSFHKQTHATVDAELLQIIDGAMHDIRALIEHCGSVSERIGFATDLTLGLISVDQNTSMRIFSIVAVFFMPPTLIASIYGMNFSRMPELNSPWGYPIALLVMVGSSILAYAIFKWRRWL